MKHIDNLEHVSTIQNKSKKSQLPQQHMYFNQCHYVLLEVNHDDLMVMMIKLETLTQLWTFLLIL